MIGGPVREIIHTGASQCSTAQAITPQLNVKRGKSVPVCITYQAPLRMKCGTSLGQGKDVLEASRGHTGQSKCSDACVGQVRTRVVAGGPRPRRWLIGGSSSDRSDAVLSVRFRGAGSRVELRMTSPVRCTSRERSWKDFTGD